MRLSSSAGRWISWRRWLRVLGAGDEMNVLEIDLDWGGGQGGPGNIDTQTSGTALVDVERDVRSIECVSTELDVVDDEAAAVDADAKVRRGELGVATGDGN